MLIAGTLKFGYLLSFCRLLFFWSRINNKTTKMIRYFYLNCYFESKVDNYRFAPCRFTEYEYIRFLIKMQHYYWFILQGFNCLCIRDVGTTFWPSFVNPINCDFKCFDRTNAIYKNECGGNSSFNIFEFDSSIYVPYYEHLDIKRCFLMKFCYIDKIYINIEI